MAKTVCPLCEKEVIGILKHLRFDHNIEDLDEIENIKKRIIEFSIFVEEQNRKLHSREISGEQYRDLMKRWKREHS